MILEVSYSPFLLVGSILIAIQAAYAGLMVATNGRHILSRKWTVESAFAAGILGVGIWSMHFVGMLAIQVGVLISYDSYYTIASALVAVLTMQLAVLIVIHGNKSTLHLTFAGGVAGLGIKAMHVLGMEAISGNCIVDYSIPGVILSTIVPVLVSIAAMQLAYNRYFRRKFKKTGYQKHVIIAAAAIVFGVSISATHYLSIETTTFLLNENPVPDSAYLMNTDDLATYVTVATFALIWCFLLVTVPRKTKGDAAEDKTASTLSALEDDAAGEAQQPTSQSAKVIQIPLDRPGKKEFIPPEVIQSVKAMGHYTMVFDGKSESMCSWPISKLETELSPFSFIRVHRSYLVNYQAVRGFRKENERGFCIVGDDEDKEIPVSRTYMPALKRHLPLK